MHETTSNISPPILVYLAMGLITARILFTGIDLRRLTRLEWLQFLVKAGSITLLWPLVLFLEKFEMWLKSSNEETK
jgi:hypothetical protein